MGSIAQTLAQITKPACAGYFGENMTTPTPAETQDAERELLTAAVAALDLYNAYGWPDRKRVRERIRAFLASPPPAQAEPSADVRVPDGWKLVPIEQTPAMVEVGRKRYMTKEDSRRWWAETLAAVPLPKAPT